MPDAVAPMSGLFGAALRRMEDPALLVGAGRFIDDLKVEGVLHAAFVRSTQAHAKIVSIDTRLALGCSGVVAVLRESDLASVLTSTRMPLGFSLEKLPDDVTPWVLSGREVCFVGEPIAIVLAASRHAAEDGVALVQVEYDILPAVADCRAATDPTAPLVRTNAGHNILKRFEVAYGDTDAAFRHAAHVFGESLWQHRGAAHPLEGRGALARPDPLTDGLVVCSSTQMPHELAATLTLMLGLPEHAVRVIAPDVGGGFGAKFLVYPEEVAVAAAARLLQQPVKWIEDRHEHFIAAIQERDQYWNLEIAVDRKAEFWAFVAGSFTIREPIPRRGSICPTTRPRPSPVPMSCRLPARRRRGSDQQGLCHSGQGCRLSRGGVRNGTPSGSRCQRAEARSGGSQTAQSRPCRKRCHMPSR